MSQWHLSRQHLSWQHLAITGLSQLLLTQFWPNFKSMYLGTSRTEFSCHSDICLGNISPEDICPYQQYLSSNWPDFQLLLTRFWPNLKSRYLGTSRTDFSCHGDICSGNTCPGYICLYQEYLNCYWPDFDETLKIGSWEHLEQIPTVMVTLVQATFVLATIVHIRNISTVTNPILMKL